MLREPGRVETHVHPADWWGQFLEVSEHVDRAYLVEGLADLIERTIAAPLLRREARIAADVVVRSLNRTGSAELAERAGAAAARLATTLQRIDDRSTAAACRRPRPPRCRSRCTAVRRGGPRRPSRSWARRRCTACS
jgi:hypothetical protein